MRQLGAQSLRKVCEPILQEQGPQVISRLSNRIHSVDTTDVHGALLALSELTDAFRASNLDCLETERQKASEVIPVIELYSDSKI